ncbi:MAG TPA: hypothetical protein VGL22_14370 [Terracidiphilus sp.]
MTADGFGSLLMAAPLLLVLVAGVLRLDEHIFTSNRGKKSERARRRFAVSDQDGEEVLTDPDGRPSK